MLVLACAVLHRAPDGIVCWQKFNIFRAICSLFRILPIPRSGACLTHFERLAVCADRMLFNCCSLCRTMCQTIAVACISSWVQVTCKLRIILTCADLQIFDKQIYFTKLCTFYRLYLQTKFLLDKRLEICYSPHLLIPKNFQQRLHVYRLHGEPHWSVWCRSTFTSFNVYRIVVFLFNNKIWSDFGYSRLAIVCPGPGRTRSVEFLSKRFSFALMFDDAIYGILCRGLLRVPLLGSAWAKEKAFDASNSVVSSLGACEALWMDIVLWTPFPSMTSACSLTFIVGKGSIDFGIGLLCIFVDICKTMSPI